MWDKDKEQLCAELSQASRKLPSLSTQRSNSKSKSSKNASANRMRPIAEHEGDLAGQGYHIYHISTTVRVSYLQIFSWPYGSDSP